MKLYGCLNLQYQKSNIDLPVPFQEDVEVRLGSHIAKPSVGEAEAGDFILASDALQPTAYIPARGERIDACYVGHINHEQELTYVIKLLLHINSEKNELAHSDIIF